MFKNVEFQIHWLVTPDGVNLNEMAGKKDVESMVKTDAQFRYVEESRAAWRMFYIARNRIGNEKKGDYDSPLVHEPLDVPQVAEFIPLIDFSANYHPFFNPSVATALKRFAKTTNAIASFLVISCEMLLTKDLGTGKDTTNCLVVSSEIIADDYKSINRTGWILPRPDELQNKWEEAAIHPASYSYLIDLSD